LPSDVHRRSAGAGQGTGRWWKAGGKQRRGNRSPRQPCIWFHREDNDDSRNTFVNGISPIMLESRARDPSTRRWSSPQSLARGGAMDIMV